MVGSSIFPVLQTLVLILRKGLVTSKSQQCSKILNLYWILSFGLLTEIAVFLIMMSLKKSVSFLRSFLLRIAAISLKSLTVSCYHVTFVFQSKSILYISLNVKELLAQNKCKVWSLSDCSRTPTYNHLVHKRTLNHLAKLAKWLSCVVSTYLYGAFDCMFSSCHIRVLEWMHTLYLPECQGIPCSKLAPNIWSLSDCNGTQTHNHLILKQTLNHLAKTSEWFKLKAQVIPIFKNQ